MLTMALLSIRHGYRQRENPRCLLHYRQHHFRPLSITRYRFYFFFHNFFVYQYLKTQKLKISNIWYINTSFHTTCSQLQSWIHNILIIYINHNKYSQTSYIYLSNKEIEKGKNKVASQSINHISIRKRPYVFKFTFARFSICSSLQVENGR